MKISVHITLYIEKNRSKKLKDFKKVCKGFKGLSNKTKIFVHTNKKIISKDKKIDFIFHDLANQDPYRLTWKCRSLMFKQRNQFDYFIYSEDDALFTKKNFSFWLKNKYKLKKTKYNVGFLRTEKSPIDGKLWSVDQLSELNRYTIIKNKKYIIVNNPYFAMWIYDKKEFNKFTKSKFWNLNNWRGLNSFTKLYDREMSAIGWHGLNMDHYDATIIPFSKRKIDKNSLIPHQPNKYIAKRGIIHVSIENIIAKKIMRFKKKKYSKLEIFMKELIFVIYWNLRFNFKNLKKKLFKF